MRIEGSEHEQRALTDCDPERPRSFSEPRPAAGRISRQAALNAKHWAAGHHVEHYANTVLAPAEVRIFVEHREQLTGRVLDVGCGAGRILAYLVMLGAEAHGIDLSPAMVEHCRRTVPGADVRVGDAREITHTGDGRFDAVIAPDNLIDVFADAERRDVLAGVATRLERGGLFVFSSHDLGALEARMPKGVMKAGGRGRVRALARTSAASVVYELRSRRESARNRRRLKPLEQWQGDFAIVNDAPHNYGLLLYYIRRDAQERQLREAGLELIECLAGDGRPVGPGGHSHHGDNLHYVARRP